MSKLYRCGNKPQEGDFVQGVGRNGSLSTVTAVSPMPLGMVEIELRLANGSHRRGTDPRRYRLVERMQPRERAPMSAPLSERIAEMRALEEGVTMAPWTPGDAFLYNPVGQLNPTQRDRNITFIAHARNLIGPLMDAYERDRAALQRIIALAKPNGWQRRMRVNAAVGAQDTARAGTQACFNDLLDAIMGHEVLHDHCDECDAFLALVGQR